MHAPEVLREQVLAVELAAFYGRAADLGVREDFGTSLQLADPGGEVQVLGRDVPLPFVLGGEGAVAAGEGEDADEGSSVCACVVALEGCGVLERRVVAGFALELSLGRFGVWRGLDGGAGTFVGGRGDSLRVGGNPLPGTCRLGRVLDIIVIAAVDDADNALLVNVSVRIRVCVGQCVVLDMDSTVLWGAFVLDGFAEAFVTWVSVRGMTAFHFEDAVIGFSVVLGLHGHLVVSLVAIVANFLWRHVREALDLAELDVRAMGLELLEVKIILV